MSTDKICPTCVGSGSMWTFKLVEVLEVDAPDLESLHSFDDDPSQQTILTIGYSDTFELYCTFHVMALGIWKRDDRRISV